MSNPTKCQRVLIDPIDDRVEDLAAKLMQLSALLMMTYGEGGEAFRCYSGDIQDAYLWACCDLAKDCASMLDGLRHGGAS